MKTILHTFVLSLIVVIMSAAAVSAQGGPPRGENEFNDGPGGRRPNLIRQLGLNRQQLQQLRRYNMQRRPLMVEAQNRFREANMRLDSAIYAEALDESEVQLRIKDVQLAQAELIKLRSMNELSIRKILTPEQLTKFRRMRQQFDQSGRAGRQARFKRNVETQID